MKISINKLFKYVYVLLFFTCSSLMSVNTYAKSMEDFNHDWRFTLEKQQAAHQHTFDHSQWSKVRLPHDWAVALPYSDDIGAASSGFKPGGIGWYRKSFNLSTKDKNKIIWLEFDGIYNNSDVWINGHHVGGRPYGYTSFSVDLTPYLNFGDKENIVAVKVNRTAYVDARWYTGSGIYRDVRLVKANDVHIPQWGIQVTSTDVSNTSANINVKTFINANKHAGTNAELKVDVRDQNNKTVLRSSRKIKLKAQTEVTPTFTIDSPNLWSLEEPQLYTAHVSVIQNGKVVSKDTARFGIRDIKFDADKGFLLNGKSVKIKGANIHHDAGAVGVAVPKSVWRSRLKDMQSVGVNAIRLSHNPHSPELLDLCDEMGILVNAEFFDEWDRAKDKSKIKLGDNAAKGEISAAYNLLFNQWAERDLKDMIRRDYNHPSVFMWSIGNEIEWTYPYYEPSVVKGRDDFSYYAHAPSYDMEKTRANIQKNNPDKINNLPIIAMQLREFVLDVDQSRPVTAGLVLPSVGFATGYTDALDLIGFNYRATEYEVAHKKFPNAVIYGSENWGSWSEWQNVKDKDYVSGIFIWTGFAYKGESGPLPKMGLNISLFDYIGNKTPRGEFFEAMWVDTPKVWLGTTPASQSEFSYDNKNGWKYTARPVPNGVWEHLRKWEWYDINKHWKYSNNESIVVQAYTNTQASELFLNGQSLGRKQASDFAEDGVMKWLVPYQSGELKIVGYNQGKAVAEDIINTHGKLAQIALSVENNTLKADGYDATYVHATLLDADGNLIPDSKAKVTFHVKGDINQMWVDNGSEYNIDDVLSDNVENYLGKAAALIQASEKKGTVSIYATANGIKSKATIIKLQ